MFEKFSCNITNLTNFNNVYGFSKFEWNKLYFADPMCYYSYYLNPNGVDLYLICLYVYELCNYKGVAVTRHLTFDLVKRKNNR